MKADNISLQRAGQTYMGPEHCEIAAFRKLTARKTDISSYPFAASVEKNILLYDCEAIRRSAQHPQKRREIMAETPDVTTDPESTRKRKSAA